MGQARGTMASRNGVPDWRSWLMRLTMTKPFSTATPDNAMKPTPSGDRQRHPAAALGKPP